MSMQALRDFRMKINETPALQAEMARYLYPEIHTWHVAHKGKEHGFDFTQEEVLELFESELARPNRELSDYELELVAGGALVGPTRAPSDPSGGK